MENEKRKIEQVKICAVGKFLAELRQGQYVDPEHAAAVICTDEPVSDGALAPLPTCRLQFLDTEDPENQRAFTPQQAQTIRDFLKSLPEDVTTLYCCCDWGQSRSAGLAAACMAAIGQDPGLVFRNRAYSPNTLVYRYMCQAFGCGLPSAEEIERLRTEGDKTTAERSARRVVLAGEADAFSARPSSDGTDGGARTPAAAPAERRGVQVADRRISGWTIPWSEEELLADMRNMGTVFAGETILLVCGTRDLQKGRDVQGCRERLRKYLFWLKYRYQGVRLRLVIPPESAFAEKDRHPAWAELAGQYAALAAEQQISILTPAQPGPLTVEQLLWEEGT